MGCKVSRLDGKGATLPACRLRPVFLQHRHGGGRPLKAADSTPSKKQLLSHDIEDINNASQHSNCNNPTKIIIIPCSLVKKPERKITPEVIKEAAIGEKKDIKIPARICNNDREEERVIKEKGKNEMKEKSREKINIEDDDFLSADEDINDGEEDDDDDDDDERMIGYEDDDAFPGSPSFRVYFEDQREGFRNDMGKKDVFKEAVSCDDSVPSKESSSSISSSTSSLEKKGKRGRKKRSLRRVLPKNLLNVKSCYTSCAHPSHRQKQPSESSS